MNENVIIEQQSPTILAPGAVLSTDEGQDEGLDRRRSSGKLPLLPVPNRPQTVLVQGPRGWRPLPYNTDWIPFTLSYFFVPERGGLLWREIITTENVRSIIFWDN